MKYAFFRLWCSLTWYKISTIYSLLIKKWVCMESDFVNEQWKIKVGNKGRILICRVGKYLCIEYVEFWYCKKGFGKCYDVSRAFEEEKEKRLIMDFCRRWL